MFLDKDSHITDTRQEQADNNLQYLHSFHTLTLTMHYISMFY